MANKLINVGVVGSGFIARDVHMPLLAKFPQVRLAAICDKNENTLADIAGKYKTAKLYTDIDEMLSNEQLDLVDICTPPDEHTELSIKCMDAGNNCMVEKPMTMKSGDAARMINKAREKVVRLYVIHNYSLMPCIVKAKRIIASGEIGRVISVDVKYLVSIEKERYFDSGHWCHRLPGGILSTEITPHLVMLLLDFMDSEKTECMQVYKGKLSQHAHIKADELKAVLYDGNTLGTLSLSYNCPYKQLSMSIAGTEGYLYVDVNSQAVVNYRPTDYGSKSAVHRGLESLSDINQRFTGLAATTINVISGRYSPLVHGHRYLMSCCWRDLRGEGKYPIPLGKCHKVVSLLEKMMQ